MVNVSHMAVMKEKLNNNGQQYHQYQQRPYKYINDHDIWRWKSRSCVSFAIL